MKKQFFTIAMTGLIGIFGVTQGQEQLPVKPVDSAEIAVETQSQAALPATQVNESPSSAVSAANQAAENNKAAQILVPFDQGLYKEFCDTKKALYKRVFEGNVKYVALGTVMLVIGLLNVQSMGPAAVSSTISGAWQAFYNSSLLTKLWNIAFTYPQQFSQVFFMCGALYQIKLLGKNFGNLTVWEERDDIVLAKQQQALWHKDILTRFDNPEIVGITPLTGKYLLKCHKKYGAGYVIFDPFDAQQVKILLGVHPSITEDLRCSKIEVIVEEVKDNTQS